MKRFLPLVIALIASAGIAFAGIYANQQKVTISGGFFTGKDYLDMSDTERRAYATGAVNGMLVAPFFGAPDDNVNWLKTCTAKMSDEQLASILSRYVRDQPKQLQQNINVVTFNALREACRRQ